MKRRRQKLHPILKEIRRRQREIAKLMATAKMLGIDLAPVLPASAFPKAPMSERKTKRYYADLMTDFYAPNDAA